ncbi:MAG: T9SS type A sorting domain-containing protein [Flavobacteriales bacterium]|nr:T9SS type A sorting domain-containing protein [Flavobacteriales bacterium]
MRYILSTAVALLSISALAQTDSITVGALQRTYTVRLPSVYDGSTALPLVIAMHGGFGSGTQLENQSQLSATAEQEGFIVVYPDGVPSPLGIRTWNAGGCCGYAMNNTIDDVGFISALLDTLFSALAIDTLRVYATGMSNGGFMSYRLACELSERIAAIAPVSASMTIDVCDPVRAMPVIALHSFLDTSVPYLGGIGDGVSGHYNSPMDSVQTAFALRANCIILNDTIVDDAEMTVIRWHDCDCGHEVITYMTQDGGHSWPGGNGTGIGDPPSTVISANELMWDFFQQYTLDCLPMSAPTTAWASPPFSIHPNPASGIIRINGAQVAHLSVQDASGREVVQRMPANGSTIILDVADLVPGIYVVRATAADGEVRAARFVRE